MNSTIPSPLSQSPSYSTGLSHESMATNAPGRLARGLDTSADLPESTLSQTPFESELNTAPISSAMSSPVTVLGESADPQSPMNTTAAPQHQLIRRLLGNQQKQGSPLSSPPISQDLPSFQSEPACVNTLPDVEPAATSFDSSDSDHSEYDGRSPDEVFSPPVTSPGTPLTPYNELGSPRDYFSHKPSGITNDIIGSEGLSEMNNSYSGPASDPSNLPMADTVMPRDPHYDKMTTEGSSPLGSPAISDLNRFDDLEVESPGSPPLSPKLSDEWDFESPPRSPEMSVDLNDIRTGASGSAPLSPTPSGVSLVVLAVSETGVKSIPFDVSSKNGSIILTPSNPGNQVLS